VAGEGAVWDVEAALETGRRYVASVTGSVGAVWDVEAALETGCRYVASVTGSGVKGSISSVWFFMTSGSRY